MLHLQSLNLKKKKNFLFIKEDLILNVRGLVLRPLLSMGAVFAIFAG
jgi:hypothetical protein